MRYLFLSLLFIYHSLSAQNYNSCVKSSNFHIVVLGSSTAAGAGPSSQDSSWVNRYRKHIQTINIQNQVSNLGVGGTTTYNIMPDWYTSPTGKPSRDSTKNISEAIRLGADAIIVNMPSNDAARGYTALEQMNNFQLLKAVADSFNIKIWVCTTQPRNGFNSIRQQIQLDTRDSIIAFFGINSIEFWSGFANATNGIDTLYDSGDGVHMNDTAHGILCKRVINKLIPNELSDTLSYIDISVKEILFHQSSCGDSLDKISIIVSNIGQTSSAPISVNFELKNLISSTFIRSNQNISLGISSCSSDTLLFSINSYRGGTFEIRAFIDSIDVNPNNDSSTIYSLTRIGHPDISITDDYYCPNDSAFLTAISLIGDTIVWYDSLNAISPIHIGSTYSFLPNNLSSTFFAQAVSGPLHFKEIFDLIQSTGINWNGYMLDMIANDSIILDSITIPINTPGNPKVITYYRYGSHKGSENMAQNWTYWGIDSSIIINSGDLAHLNYPELRLTPNDTLAIYLHLQNQNSSLSYKWMSSANIRSDSKLSVYSGTGVSHTFGTTYYPRNFSGKIHYHHGFNPKGDCQSARIAVNATENQAYLDLGNDTILNGKDSLYLNLPNSFKHPIWSNGDTSRQILVNVSNFGIGLHLISVIALDSIGCENRDTILVQLNLTLGLSEHKTTSLHIKPNPSNGLVYIDKEIKNGTPIQVFDQYGRLIKNEVITNQQLDLRGFPKGIYFLVILLNQQSRKVTLLIQ
ncbi:MAG: T9SS type A sorting domain-containing protein [Flavobacteriales bacterium]|nr:T9SS type A sorting domain-containing protein [Flavobacteriales bacterium]